MRFSVITAVSRSIRGLSLIAVDTFSYARHLLLPGRGPGPGVLGSPNSAWDGSAWHGYQMYIVINSYRLNQIVDVVILELQFSLSLDSPSCYQLSVALSMHLLLPTRK